MPEMAEEVLGMPVRRGYPQGVGGLTDVVKSPAYSTGVGLVLHGHKRAEDLHWKRKSAGGIGTAVGRLWDWIAANVL
jgi:cell division protein FtsA